MTPASQENLSVLVGNGLSIAFNPELRLDVLTRDVMERIKNDYSGSGEEIARAMQRVGSREGNPRDDFEVLIGAFGGQTRILRDLRDYAELVDEGNADLHKSIELVGEFAEKVRDHGISHVLELIMERSVARRELATELNEFVRTVVARFTGDVAFANLNYDTLVLSALVASFGRTFTDLADARLGVDRWIDDVEVRMLGLRQNMSDFPSDRRIRLLHLHGSLTFWHTPSSGYRKIEVKDVRTHGLWKKIREGTTSARPLVVLANQHDKSGAVAEQPFKLAYQAYSESLDNSDHWLIVGYSFRDECVNKVLHDAWTKRGKEPAKVLVVTLGDEPSAEDVEATLGWSKFEGPSSKWLFFERRGVEAFADSTGPWFNQFAGSTSASA